VVVVEIGRGVFIELLLWLIKSLLLANWFYLTINPAMTQWSETAS
jgi:hypothetical protein